MLPDKDSLEILTFGSNIQGYHSLGVAKVAFQQFGAIRYQGVGLQGKSYGIPTRSWDSVKYKMFTLPFDEVAVNILDFCQFTIANPELKFFVTSVGCGYAGFSPEKIAPLFKTAINCSFPENWDIYLEE